MISLTRALIVFRSNKERIFLMGTSNSFDEIPGTSLERSEKMKKSSQLARAQLHCELEAVLQ